MEIAPGDASEVATASRELLWSTLVQWLSAAERSTDPRWERLASLADSPLRREQFERLTIHRALSTKNWPLALDSLWKRLPSDHAPLIDGNLVVDHQAWLAGSLRDLWTSGDEAIKRDLSERILARIGPETDQLPNDAPALARLFGFHPYGRRLTLAIARSDAEAGRFALAESRLLQLRSAPEPDLAAQALTRLAELYADRGCDEDSLRVTKLLAALPPKLPSPKTSPWENGSTIGRRDHRAIAPQHPPRPGTWKPAESSGWATSASMNQPTRSRSVAIRPAGWLMHASNTRTVGSESPGSITGPCSGSGRCPCRPMGPLMTICYPSRPPAAACSPSASMASSTSVPPGTAANCGRGHCLSASPGRTPTPGPKNIRTLTPPRCPKPWFTTSSRASTIRGRTAARHRRAAAGRSGPAGTRRARPAHGR